MKLAKVKKPSERTDWSKLFSAFLASGNDAMELVDWQTNHKNFNSAYLTAYLANQVNGFDKYVRVSIKAGRIYLIRKEGAGDDAE